MRRWSRRLALLAIGILLLIEECSSVRKPKPEKDDATGKSSLAFVFDITGSMFDDLVQVREGAAKIFKTVMAQREKLIYNYIMVPFHDPHLGDIINTTDSTYFMRQLGKVYVHGGGDCPEKTLTGILKALEIALPSSFVYVFTDARSKDYHLEDQVLNIIQEKQSSVVFVMTGDCGNRTHPGFKTYEKIAAASFGQVFHLEKSDVSTVLEYVRHAVKQKKVHMMYEARERGGTTVRGIPVDKHLSELTISLSGDKDDSDVLDIAIRDPRGHHVDKQTYSREGGTIDLKNVKLIRLKDPIPGTYQITTNSRLKHTIRVFGHGSIDFKYGFAVRPLDQIELARPRPVLNQNTYLLVNMTGLIPPGVVTEISLVDYFGNSLYSNPASPSRTNPHMYYVGPFIPPKGLFFVQVVGVDEEDYEFKRIAPTAIGSVVVGGPRAFMAPYHEGFVGKKFQISCTVESASSYLLYWYKDDELIGGPLFYDATDTAVWGFNELSLRDSGEYKCQVISNNGNHSITTRVEARESAPVIIGARNISVPLGSPAFLHCPAKSAGPVEIRWIRHGSTVFTGPNTERNLANGTLKLHVVSRSDAGIYECQARNAGGMTSIKVRLDIMEPPKAHVVPEKVYFNPNENLNISCTSIGEPKPELHWYYRGNRLVTDTKYFVGYESKSLFIRGAGPADQGVYECRAMSAAGTDIDSAEVIMAAPPKVDVSQSKTMIGRGDSITFDCKILEGKPYPKIRWLRNGKELLVSNDKYIRIQGTTLQITGAQDSDGGSYSCVAENMAGRDISVVQLAIGRMPSIVPSPETVRVNIERQATLQCLAIGYPTPTIEWEKGGVSISKLNNNRYTQLPDGNLLISDVSVEDQDRFTCIAKNVYGTQSQTTAVMVTGLVSPVLGHVPPEEQLIEGQDLHLSCVVVLGTPRPNIVWLKDGKPVETSPTLIVEGGGTSLLLRGGNPKDEGKYTCVAISPAGNATLNINVQLIKKPEFVILPHSKEKPKVPGIDETHVAHVNTTHDVLDGGEFAIPCVVHGQPPPTITWYRDGRPIAANNKEFLILPDNTLVVRKADKSHNGVYTCQAANSAGETNQDTTIRIMNIPRITAGQSSYNMVVNDSMTIPCEAYGEPKPKFSWLLNGKPFTEGIINEDGSLTIPHLREIHRGTFSCIAENAAGVDVRNVSLTVHTAPQIELDNQEKVVLLNGTIVLECPAQALPPPERVWTYEGEKIDSQLIPHTIRDDGALVLHNMKLENTGMFTCHVSNLAGEDSLHYTVKVHEKPKIISEIPGTVDVVKGLTIEIPCRATGIPEVTRIWQKNGINLDTSSSKYTVDNMGTLRIHDALVDDAAVYNCVVSNSQGTDVLNTTVVVQEPPVILPTTNTNYTAVIGDVVEMRCYVDAHPAATIQWFRRGIAVTEKTNGVKVQNDGTLVIEEASLEDATIYTCKASNPAGKDEKNLQLTIIAAPEIPNQDVIQHESVKESQPFSLYCPVLSTPIPTITWYLNDKPMVAEDAEFALSDDKRRLHVFKAKITDSGVYKCVARNAAGEGSKMFQVEVVVPLIINEDRWAKKMYAKEGESVVLGCPVTGYPDPKITWVIDGKIIDENDDYKDIKISEDGNSINITNVGVKHEGFYHCVAQGKTDKLDVDVELVVLAKPRLGKDEDIELVAGKGVILTCDLLNEVDDFTTFAWSVNGSETDFPANVKIPNQKSKLYIAESYPNNSGIYKCRVTNAAGKSEKTIKLKVMEPPEFVEKDYEENQKLIVGTPLILSCLAKGDPKPDTKWFINGQEAHEENILDGDRLRIETLMKQSNQVSCVVTNKAGSISRDFFVQRVDVPYIGPISPLPPIYNEGEAITLDCPIANNEFNITWLKHGKPMIESEAIFTLDRTRMTILNAKPEHQDVYTCIVKNAAGEASRDFNVEVQVAPRIIGLAVENIETKEGEDITLYCPGEGNPKATIHWELNTTRIPERFKLLAENETLVIENITKHENGVYKCFHYNNLGEAVKTFNVVVRVKPEFIGGGTPSEKYVDIGRSVSLECPVADMFGAEITWTASGKKIGSGTIEGAEVMSNGRFLSIHKADLHHDATYICTVTNPVGSASKVVTLHVNVPSKILTDGGKYSVIENNSLVLPCVVEGTPRPKIYWRKEDMDATELPSVQILSEGQQFKIVHADITHSGSYSCKAQNGVGNDAINFEVDVITRPSLAKGVKDVVEVIEGQVANFKCPIADKNFRGTITWLYNQQPIDLFESKKYALSHNERRMSLHRAQTEDEGLYSCKIKNSAGETKFDYKLQVLIPPTIVMLDKDKNRTVIEKETVVLSCPATGKPEPDITWYKDGEGLNEDNIKNVIASGVLEGNELKIESVQDQDSGRYTCEAENVAGSTEQEVNLNVLTIPRIITDDIPSYNEFQLGQQVTLSCPVLAKPPANVTWLKKGKPLESNKYVKTSANGQKLYFLKLDIPDADKYTCVATNTAGEDRRDFEISLLIAPTFDEPNIVHRVQVNLGKPTTILCPAYGSPTPTITWLKDGISVKKNNKTAFFENGRVLTLETTDPSDAGRYTCIATNVAGSDDLETTLEVIVPPEIKGPEHLKLVAIEGDRVDLPCDTPNLGVEFEWQKNGQSISPETLRGDAFLQIPSSGKRMTFLSARHSDSGRYTCIMRNAAGESRKTFELDVQVPPEILEDFSSASMQTVNPGSTIDITCITKGYPTPTIDWWLNDDIIPPFEQITYIKNKETLRITNITDKFAGKYSCSAINAAGRTKKDFVVQVKSPPKLDKESEFIELKVGQSTVLACNVESSSQALISWKIRDTIYRTGGRVTPSVEIRDNVVEINNVKTSDDTVYTCIAENDAGKAEKDYFVSVIQYPKFYDVTTEIAFVIDQPLVLDCRVHGSPTPTSYWMKVSHT
ncbi:unnamed protein product [Caenorhabditis bovis]|uniref:Ig-like domain-containing protein n=1 Tax=Caenorhabditis bovis TaxID=2654633 RepID=A0A8S1EI68_9PELO|nr:unnamed protein product [Caenorhabditis bovis]